MNQVLTNGQRRSMIDTRAVISFTAFVVLGFFVAPGEAQVSDRYLPTWVQHRADVLSAKFADRPFEKIGWVEDLPSALKLAAEHDRPVFLFTHNGRMDTGRC